MLDKIIKFKLTLLLTIFFCSCGLLKESNNKIIYKSIDHDQYKPVIKPDYSNLNSWLVHPDHVEKNDFLIDNDGKKRADVFFIAPTLFSDKKIPIGIPIFMMKNLKIILSIQQLSFKLQLGKMLVIFTHQIIDKHILEFLMKGIGKLVVKKHYN